MFTIAVRYPQCTVTVERTLSSEEESSLAATFEGMQLGLKLEVIVAQAATTSRIGFKRAEQGDIDLMPSRALSKQSSNELRWQLEADEEFWLSNRLVSGTASSSLPTAFRDGRSRCLVNTTFAPRNIRLYLPLYRHVSLIMPLASSFDAALAGLRVSEVDLLTLAEKGRVGFVLPQSVDRYPARFLELLAERAPASLLFSRRLAVATVRDGRKRMPFLYPTAELSEWHSFLHDLHRASREATSPQLRSLCFHLASDLAAKWLASEKLMHRLGAMSVPMVGLGSSVAAILKSLTGRDFAIELTSASAAMEWAAAMSATIVPAEMEGYSEQGATEICASMYSGVRNEALPSHLAESEIVLADLLAIDNDAPVLDVADAIGGDDVDRMRKIAENIASENLDEDFRRNAVEQFNGRVRQFEKHQDRLKRLNIVALAGSLAAASAPVGVEYKPLISLGGWFLGAVLNGITSSGSKSSWLLDQLRGANAWTSADVVLVSRLKKELQS